MATIDTPVFTDGHLRTRGGLILPPSMARSHYVSNGTTESSNIATFQNKLVAKAITNGFANGYALDKEPNTKMFCWPRKGSGLDDYVMSKLVDGDVSNVGQAPVLSSLLSTLVQKQAAQAANADIVLSGRKTPVGKARDAIARMNDSPLGVTAALQEIVYKLLVYNAGCPISTIPITYPTDQWPDFGMNLIPILTNGETESEATKFYIDMDWSKFGSPVPFLPSPFSLQPTGQNDYPYWFLTELNNRKVNVLLSSEQIIELIPGYSMETGIGTSSCWIATEQLATYIVIKDAEAERSIAAPTEGFIGISGIKDDAADVKEKIEEDREVSKARGRVADKGYTIFTSETPIDFKTFSFRDVTGITNDAIERLEDRVVAAFRMSLSEAGLSRKGVGYAGQATTTSQMSADSGVGYPLGLLATALGAIYPRVQIAITRPNDYAKEKLISDFKTFSDSVKGLPVGVLSNEEIRALIESFVGIQIPNTQDGEVTTSPGSKDDSSSDTGGSDTGTDDEAPTPTETAQAIKERTARLLCEYMQVRQFANVVQVLESDTGNVLKRIWRNSLRAQYASAPVRRIVQEIRSTGIDEADPTAVQRTIPIVEAMTDPLNEHINRQAVLDALIAVAKFGRLEADDQARAAGQQRLTARDRAEIDREVEADINERLDELLLTATGGPEGDVAPIREQGLDSTLDPESYVVIASLIIQNMRAYTQITDIEAGYNRSYKDYADTRGTFIAENEGGRFYSNSFSQAALFLLPISKRWNMTTSAVPRDIHLATVGEVVGLDQRFSSGDSWSQERYNCKCSITLLWG